MNKFFVSIAIVAVIAIVLGTASPVYAQTPAPQRPGSGSGYGFGMGGGRGMGMRANGIGTHDGFMHDEMIAAFAQKLGISASDLEAQLDKGETVAQIAVSKGLTFEQFRTLMTEGRAQAIDQAVKGGKLTQQQADWMKQRGAGMGFRGANGQCANPACPYNTPTAP
jgi:hypothetical protein